MDVKTRTELAIGADLATALTFDDVLLVPQHSQVLPYQVDVSTNLTRHIRLNVPLEAVDAHPDDSGGVGALVGELLFVAVDCHRSQSNRESGRESTETLRLGSNV